MTFMPDEDYYSINPPFPREITIDINNRCNHTCYFCANNKIEHYAAIETNLAYDLMKQAYVAGCTDLAFQATGEPFMDKRLTDFVSEGKRIGFDYIYINTNGALATPDKVNPVAQAGLDSIKFSINGASREEYKQVHGQR